METLITLFLWGLAFGAGFTLGKELVEMLVDPIWAWLNK